MPFCEDGVEGDAVRVALRVGQDAVAVEEEGVKFRCCEARQGAGWEGAGWEGASCEGAAVG